MTPFWIAAWALAVLVCVLPPAVTLASVKRELRERERRRANIRKMNTSRLLAAVEDYDRYRPEWEWDLLVELARRRTARQERRATP